jgi:hypothetical protein
MTWAGDVSGTMDAAGKGGVAKLVTGTITYDEVSATNACNVASNPTNGTWEDVSTSNLTSASI